MYNSLTLPAFCLSRKVLSAKLLMKSDHNQPVNPSFFTNSLLTSFDVRGDAFRRQQRQHLGAVPGYITEGLLFVRRLR